MDNLVNSESRLSMPGGPRILVLVLAVEREPWKSLESPEALLWRTTPVEGVTVRRYVGTSRFGILGIASGLSRRTQVRLEEHPGLHSRWSQGWNRLINARTPRCTDSDQETITVEMPDTYWLIGAKTLATFAHALSSMDFDFIYRTNTSSYVHLPGLLEVASHLPLRRVYAGYPGYEPDGHRFASGSGYLLSRDMVELVVANRESWPHEMIDDVALSHLISDLGVAQFTSVPRVTLSKPSQVDELRLSDLSSCFQYRCKVSDPLVQIEIMRRLHSRFWGADSSPLLG